MCCAGAPSPLKTGFHVTCMYPMTMCNELVVMMLSKTMCNELVVMTMCNQLVLMYLCVSMYRDLILPICDMFVYIVYAKYFCIIICCCGNLYAQNIGKKQWTSTPRVTPRHWSSSPPRPTPTPRVTPSALVLFPAQASTNAEGNPLGTAAPTPRVTPSALVLFPA